jgi:hypothetical protein
MLSILEAIEANSSMKILAAAIKGRGPDRNPEETGRLHLFRPHG